MRSPAYPSPLAPFSPLLVPAVFDWSNTQNGKLIGSIGIVSAVLQGGYVRRSLTRVGELNMARRGTSSCAIGLVALALIPHFTVTRPDLAVQLLKVAAVCMGFTSATVVNALTAHASLQCDDAPEGAAESSSGSVVRPQLATGQALGRFRSSGQLGRAIGPLLGKTCSFVRWVLCADLLSVTACASYWTFGPSITYAVAAVAMGGLSAHMRRVARKATVKTA